jgi:hypothetical protein
MSKVQLINLDSFYAGDHQSFTMYFTDDNDQVMDLNNRRIVFTAKQDLDDADNYNSPSQIRKIIDISEDTPVTELVFDLFTAETRNKNYGQYDYDLKISFLNLPHEIQFTAIRGKFSILQPVSDSME